MSTKLRSIAVLAAAAILAAAMRLSAQQQTPPRFSASVEVTSVDVTVVDDKGRPIMGLTPADFTVKVDGNPRQISSAQWVSLTTDGKESSVFVPPGYSSNENATGGRLIVIAVDQPNIRFGANRTIVKTASSFIDRLTESDRIAVTGFGLGAANTPFTSDRERAKQALAHMNGQKESRRHDTRSVSIAEAQAIERGDRNTLAAVQDRECRAEASARNGGLLEVCRAEVETVASQVARDQGRESDQTLDGLRNLFEGLKSIDAPKTLILISEGFVMEDPGWVIEIGQMAANARTALYVLRLDRDAFDASEARMPIDPFGDRVTLMNSLETLAAATRGAVYNVTTDASQIFEHVEAELSGYYLLAVDVDPRDRDGKPHQIRVDVSRRGAIVRSRRQIVNVQAEAQKRSPREAITSGLSSPLLLTALPVRVSTYALQGPDTARIQLLIHADIGTDYSASRPISVGFMLLDRTGKLVDSQAVSQRLMPVLNGVPSPLQFTGGASVAPGDYTLKLAAADGDKVGSVEHPVHASLAAGGDVTVSDLTVGGPVESGELLTPTVGYTVSFGTLHGYVEAYGAGAGKVTASFDIAAAEQGPALLTIPVQPRPAGETRVLFSRVVPIHQLPAGKYVLRATLKEGDQPVKTLTRPFEIAPPAVLLTAADGLSKEKSADAELFLPVGDDLLAQPFNRVDALKPETLDVFKARVAPALKPSFDVGVAAIAAGEYVKAELSFKKAIQPDADSTPALTYLGVCFAASGHDPEAASAFQTALVDGADVPQIYAWLGEAMLRTHDLAEARGVFEEAAGKWPADIRFTRPLAMLYATFGRGREAVRTLERYLEARTDDADGLFLGVEWIYHVHAAGGVVHNRAQDLKLAHGYSDLYEKNGGAQMPLVKQWLDFLASER
jgi:VWFA-related protein